MPILRPTIIVCLLTYVNAFGAPKDDPTAILESRLRALEYHVTKQDERIVALVHEVAEQTTQLEATHQKLRLFSNDIEDDSVKGRDRRAAAPKVAFSAYLDHQMNHVGIDSIIPFNQVILNDGGAYNPITGIFTVPVTGVYLFTYSVNTEVTARQLVVKLVLDGVNMSDGTSDPFHDLQEIQGGNTVLFRANTGQSVWLAAYNTGNTIVDGREDYRFSTLSGVLLYT